MLSTIVFSCNNNIDKVCIIVRTHLQRVHVYEATAWQGEPAESDEMTPQWYNEADIPYAKMWADDAYWMPLFLAGKHFKGVFNYSDDETIVQHTLQEVDSL
jgi:hypothetical protein